MVEMRKRIYGAGVVVFAIATVALIVAAGFTAVQTALLVDTIPGADDGRGISPQLHQLQTTVSLMFLAAVVCLGAAIIFAVLAFGKKS